MENIICIVSNNAQLDYFDLRALFHTSKHINTVIRSYYNDMKRNNELYILIHDYFLLYFPKSKQKYTNISGIKIVFNADDYFNSLIIGIDTIMNKIYIARANEYDQFDIDDGWKHRDFIAESIQRIKSNIKNIDIYYYNLNITVLNNFLGSLLKITKDKDLDINIHSEDFLSNILLSHH